MKFTVSKLQLGSSMNNKLTAWSSIAASKKPRKVSWTTRRVVLRNPSWVSPYLFNNQILELKPNIYTANLLNQYIKLKTSESPYGAANSLIRNLIYYIVTPNAQLCKINQKNWYDIININNIHSYITSYKIIIKGRISTKGSRSKTYLLQSNSKYSTNNDKNIKALILKNGSTGINIRIDSILIIS
jgi:hypothetical protein